MAIIERTIAHASGIPLGGIGAGSVEIREDGLFHEWQIFNLGAWSPRSPQPTCCGGAPALPTMAPDDLVFILRTEGAGDGVKVRFLAMREELNNLYSLSWLKCVQSIEFRGEFPVARLAYQDESLPVAVAAEVFAPFIPHQPRESATPGFYVRFAVANISDEPITVSILGRVANPIPCGERIHTVAQEGDVTLLTLAADGIAAEAPYAGSLTLAARGGEHTYIAGAFDHERKGYLSWHTSFGLAARSALFEFREQGALTDSAVSCPPAPFPEGFDAKALPPQERRELFEALLQQSSYYQKYRRIADCDPTLLESDEQIAAFINDIAGERKGDDMSGDDHWRDALLCATHALAPRQDGTVLFALGWFFPNHISPKSGNIGHMYANWFADSADVSRWLLANHDDCRRRTVGFAAALYDTTLDYALADSIAAQLSTLPKCAWWTKSGDFGVWEGLGCCGFHTTDITYDGSFSILALFPSLQKQQMVMGAKFQREDGRIPHFFTPDFSQTDGDYARVDMNPQFVLLVARDYLWTGDRDYLETLWQPVVRAIENTRLLDGDDDGLPDHDCARQTYDVWEFYGCPSYIASLWLASLKAGMRLAREMGDAEREARWADWYDRGGQSFEKLWNGEYYVLWKEMGPGGRVDECCMSDQIDGDWFTALMGWGSVLPAERIKGALEAIFYYNYNSEDGLKNATYPPGKTARISTYGNLQAEAPWTGIEYAIASLFLEYGMLTEGLEIVENVYDRYLRAGRVWNHVECGDHYYRAMSSWALLLSLSGFRVDAPEGKLAFAPALPQDPFRVPYVSPSSWGSYCQAGGFDGWQVTVQCLGGAERMRVLAVGASLDPGRVIALVNGRRVPCCAAREEGVVKLIFEEPAVLTEGDRLVITDH